MGDAAQFSATARELLQRKGLGVRAAARKSRQRISTTTILNMLEEHIPNSDVIVEFASAVGDSPAEVEEFANDLLEKAGKRVRLLSIEPCGYASSGVLTA